jgi:hypothetical protein
MPFARKEKPMYENRCKHYTGYYNILCEQGIRYDSFPVMPCWDGRQRSPEERLGLCPHFSLPTMAELAAEKARVDQALAAWLTEAATRDAHGQCLHCGVVLTGKRQVGRCTYSEPCGCRAYQGTLRDAQGKKVQYLPIGAARG